MKAIKNIRIYDFDNFIDNGYIIYDKNIIDVGSMENFDFTGKVIDGKGKIVIPGLVNGHTHIYSTLFRGLALPFNPKSFKDILKQLWWKFDNELFIEAIYYSGMIYGMESLKNGVTTLIDHHASGEIKGSLKILKNAIVDQLGMRIILAFETSDRFDIYKCIEENQMVSNYKSDFCNGLFGMHASMSLSDESLKIIKDQIKKTPIHIHIAESIEDEEDSYKKYNESIVKEFSKRGLINDGSILAHCVHINEDEAYLLKDKNIYVALNPSSNLNNNVGIFNYNLLKDLRIIVGTDGLGSNVSKEIYNLNLLIKRSLNSPLGVKLEKIIEFINNSYEVVNERLDIKIGKLKRNYKADFLLIDYKNPTPINGENIFSHILYGIFDSLKPEKVFINGKEVLKDYKLNISEKNYDEIYKESLNVSSKLFKKFGDVKDENGN